MTVDPLFTAASEAAEQSLEWLVAADSCAAKGEVADALKCLEALAELAETELAEVLERMRDTLAGVAEGKIASHRSDGMHYYSSAHEAVKSIWLTSYVMVLNHTIPPPDLLESMGVNISALRAGICRERAKLLKQLGVKAQHIEDPFLPARSPSEWAKMFGVHLTTLKRYIKNRKVRCIKESTRSWRLHRNDVDKFVDS